MTTVQSDDIGRLFAVMRANYGYRWPHTADDIPVWQAKLRANTQEDVMRTADKAIDAYPDHPPSIGQFRALIHETVPRLTGPAQENFALADRVYAYTKPQSKTNPKGNPHQISLPAAISDRRPGETAEQYEKRISEAVTFAMYPHLGHDGRSRGYR